MTVTLGFVSPNQLLQTIRPKNKPLKINRLRGGFFECKNDSQAFVSRFLVPRAGFDKPKIGETDKIEKERYLFDI